MGRLTYQCPYAIFGYKTYSCPFIREWLEREKLSKVTYLLDAPFCPEDIKRDKFGSAICFIVQTNEVEK